MRVLTGRLDAHDPDHLSDDEVAAAYPWPDRGRWVRAMMVTTLDGASSGPDGLSGSISGRADKAIFHAVRRHADVVLVGAGTLRAERYGPVGPGTVLAVVSGSLDLPWDDAVFTQSDPRTVVLTGPRAPADRLARARERADVVLLPGEAVEADAVLDELERRGLRRIVCEGGPSLLRAVVAAGLLDEADITVSPLLAGSPGGPEHRIDPPVALDLRHVLEADGFLMTRYVRPDSP